MSTYATLPMSALNNTTKHCIDDKVKKYKEGSIIFYSGVTNDYFDFYAKIDKIEETNMDLTVLELEYDGDCVHFYETDSHHKAITQCLFYLLEAKS